MIRRRKRKLNTQQYLEKYAEKREMLKSFKLEYKREYNRQYYKDHRDVILEQERIRAEKNPEGRKAHQKRYVERHKAEVNARSKAWAKRNPDKVKEARKKWAEKNPETIKAWRQASYQRNKEKAKARAVAYYHKNKEKILANLRKKREQMDTPQIDPSEFLSQRAAEAAEQSRVRSEKASLRYEEKRLKEGPLAKGLKKIKPSKDTVRHNKQPQDTISHTKPQQTEMDFIVEEWNLEHHFKAKDHLFFNPELDALSKNLKDDILGIIRKHYEEGFHVGLRYQRENRQTKAKTGEEGQVQAGEDLHTEGAGG